MLPNLLKSKFFLVFGSILLLLLGLSWGREVYNKYRINQEIGALKAEIEALESSGADISSLLSYLRTPEYKERQARELLNLQKPGEFVVALPQAGDGDDGLVAGQNAREASNLRRWWDYFFAK